MKTFSLVMFFAIVVLWAPPFLRAQVVDPGEEAVTAAEAQTGGETAEEESEEAEHEEGPLALVFRWINFAILFGGLGYLLRKPAAEFFEARRAEILGGLERSRRAQEDAARQMSAIEDRLSRLSSDIAQIRAEAEASARSEKDRIVADARNESARAVAQSRAEVDRLARGLERDVRGEIADRIIAQTEQKLRTRLTGDDRVRLIRRAVEGL